MKAGPRSTAHTRLRDILVIVSRIPQRPPRVVLFLAITLLARCRARRLAVQSSYSTWPRDESSRDVRKIRYLSPAHGTVGGVGSWLAVVFEEPIFFASAVL